MSPDRLIQDKDHNESPRTRLARRITLLALFLMLTLLLLSILYVAILVRGTQIDRGPATKDTLRAATAAEASTQRIKDCTEPSGTCFEEGQRRTAALVQAIVDEIVTTREVSVLAAACSTDPTLKDLTRIQRINTIDACVQAALKARNARR